MRVEIESGSGRREEGPRRRLAPSFPQREGHGNVLNKREEAGLQSEG